MAQPGQAAPCRNYFKSLSICEKIDDAIIVRDSDFEPAAACIHLRLRQ